MSTRPLAATVVVAVALVVAAAGCAGSGAGGEATGGSATGATGGSAAGTAGAATAPATTARPPGTVAGRPLAIAHSQRTLVDPSRPTPAGSQTPALPDRTLVTEVYLPDTPGPRPLIVFSHGLFGHPDKFTHLLEAWASAGYVVVAPAFPLTNDQVPGAAANARDLWQQPGDVSFVLDRVLAANDDPADVLHDRIDTERIGAAGLSLGGATTLALTFNPCCTDHRIDAAEVLSGNPIPMPEAYAFAAGGVPVLIVHGDADATLRLSTEREVYEAISTPKMFVTLLGGTHAPPFEDPVTPYDDLVERTTTAFWDLTIGGDASARQRLDAAARVPGLTAVDDALG